MAKLTLEDAKWQVLDILATDGKVFRHELRKQDKVLVQAADFLVFAGEIEMGTNVMGQQVWYRLKGIEEAGATMTNVAEFISSDELRRLGYTAVYDGGREQWARLRWSVRTEEYRVLFYRNTTEVKTESYVRLKNARAAARSWAGVTDDGTREE